MSDVPSMWISAHRQGVGAVPLLKLRHRRRWLPSKHGGQAGVSSGPLCHVLMLMPRKNPHPVPSSGIVRMFRFVKTLNSHHTFFLGGGDATTGTKNGRNEQKAEVWTCSISASTGSCPRTTGPRAGRLIQWLTEEMGRERGGF